MKVGFDGEIKLEFHGAYGAKIVRHSGYVTFQIAEAAISKEIFAKILSRIEQLRCRKYLEKNLEEVIFGYQWNYCELLQFINLIWEISVKYLHREGKQENIHEPDTYRPDRLW